MNLQFLLLKYQMNAKKMISFNYNQYNAVPFNNFQTYSSCHFVNTVKTLTFIYQNPSPLPKIQKLSSFPSVSYEQSIQPPSSQQQSSIKSSKKINVISTRHRKVRTESNALPKSLSTDMQEESGNINKQKQLKDDNIFEKGSNKSANPEAQYTYSLPNHISYQINNKPNCELFSICKEPDEQEPKQSKDKDSRTGKNTTISQEVKPQQKQLKSATRQRIFEPEKINPFNIQQESIQIREPQILNKIQESIVRSRQFNSQSIQNSSFQRKRLFSQFSSSQPIKNRKMCTILEQSIDINDIPQSIIQNWQQFEPKIKQWSIDHEPNQSSSNKNDHFRHLQ